MDGAHDAPAAAPAPHAAGAAPAATKPPGTKVFDSSLRYAAGMEHRPTDSTTAYDIDIEALADKPWRRAGADISDYFNYGFNERTWVVYAATMRQMRAQAEEQARQAAAAAAAAGADGQQALQGHSTHH